MDPDGVPSFFPKEPVESPEVTVGVQPASLSGKVVVAPDETLLTGNVDVSNWPAVPDSAVSVTLKGKDEWGYDVEITLPKKSNGTFTFEGLPPTGANGGYSITQTQPAGYLDYIDVAPNGNGTVPVGYVKDGQKESITGVAVLANGNVQGLIFAEAKPGTISGFTFLDVDGNKFHSTGDGVINSVELTLSGLDYTGTPVPAGVTQLSGGGAHTSSTSWRLAPMR